MEYLLCFIVEPKGKFPRVKINFTRRKQTRKRRHATIVQKEDPEIQNIDDFYLRVENILPYAAEVACHKLFLGHIDSCRKFRFLRKLRFLTKIWIFTQTSIFNQNLDFYENFDF